LEIKIAELQAEITVLERGNGVLAERVRSERNQNEQLKTQIESLEKEVKKSVGTLNDFKKRVRALGNEF
jgi:chromosome segregation ATPase